MSHATDNMLYFVCLHADNFSQNSLLMASTHGFLRPAVEVKLCKLWSRLYSRVVKTARFFKPVNREQKDRLAG